MGRYGWFLASALLVAALPAFGRTWHYDQGTSVEGEFVRMVQGRAVISASGRMVQVPFGHLSPEDQDFVREQLESRGLGGQLPAKKKTAASDASAQPKSTAKDASDHGTWLGPERTWTDVLGRTVRARFIGVEDAKVVLQVKGRISSFPFDKFSLADQQYVRGEMTSRGEVDKVPNVAPPAIVQSAPAAPPVAQTWPPSVPSGGPPNFPGDGFPAMPRIGEARTPPITPTEPAQPAPLPAPAPVHVPTFAPVVHTPPAPFAPPQPPESPANAQTTVKICSNCGHVVPANLTAGDRCPNCGVFFEVDQTTGKRAHWVYFTTPGGIGAVIGLIIYALRRRRS